MISSQPGANGHEQRLLEKAAYPSGGRPFEFLESVCMGAPGLAFFQTWVFVTHWQTQVSKSAKPGAPAQF
jgi:hypothetical protein